MEFSKKHAREEAAEEEKKDDNDDESDFGCAHDSQMSASVVMHRLVRRAADWWAAPVHERDHHASEVRANPAQASNRASRRTCTSSCIQIAPYLHLR